MKLGIMQPYFFPFLNHFALIANTDRWVVFDLPQYTPRGYMNRNRILHPKESFSLITVPLNNSSRNIKIQEAEVLDPSSACDRIVGQLNHYKKFAPFFAQVNEIVRQTFGKLETKSLVELNVRGLSAVCEYLEIPFNFEIASKQNYPLPAGLQPGEWALEISSVIGADEYVNPMGGYAIFDDQKFESRGIKLSFLNLPSYAYPTPNYQFIPHLSILDVMMWKSPEEIRGILRKPIIASKAEILADVAAAVPGHLGISLASMQGQGAE